MPLQTFPDAMKAAAALIENNQMEDANLVIYEPLNTLVVGERYIPLPILRAEVVLKKAELVDAQEEGKKEEVLQLLNNAEYQLILAEELGYGKRDQEYQELSEAIEGIKDSVEEDGESQGLFKSLRNKISIFKNKIS